MTIANTPRTLRYRVSLSVEEAQTCHDLLTIHAPNSTAIKALKLFLLKQQAGLTTPNNSVLIDGKPVFISRATAVIQKAEATYGKELSDLIELSKANVQFGITINEKTYQKAEQLGMKRSKLDAILFPDTPDTPDNSDSL